MISRSTLCTKLSKGHNQQLGCRLFVLPAELRNRIFAIALLSCDIQLPGAPSYADAPVRIRKRINTSLLSTCRRIYLETHTVPVYINEHLFWCDNRRKAPDLRLYFSRLTYSQRCAVVRVHFMTDMEWLMHTFPTVCNLRVMSYTKHLKITIRNGNWWDSDNNGRRLMKKNWTRNLAKLESLENLEVELQWAFQDDSMDQLLDETVATMLKWQLHFPNGQMFSTADKSDYSCRETSYNMHQKLWWSYLKNFRIVTLTWKTSNPA